MHTAMQVAIVNGEDNKKILSTARAMHVAIVNGDDYKNIIILIIYLCLFEASTIRLTVSPKIW
jgi:hypothetical protein